MNENTENLERITGAVADMTEDAVQLMREGASLVGDTVPIFIQELLMWNFITSLMLFITFLIIQSFIVFGNYKLCAVAVEEEKKKDYDGDPVFACFVISACGFGVSIINAVIFFRLDWLKIWIAPHVWLTEYSLNLLK